MNEWFKKTTETIKSKWGKWTGLQKAIAGGILLAVIVAIVLMARMSSRPTAVKLFSAPVNDEQERTAILTRLDEDSRTHAYVSSDNFIYVENESIAKKYRSQLIAEGLAPSRMDSFALFDVTRWSRTQFDDQVNWKRSMESLVKSHLESLDGIMRAEVVLTLPEESLFSSNQNPTTASVILYSRGGSDILEDKKQIRGIQNLIMRAVEGLKGENISIVNGATGQEINDFEGMAESDRLSNIDKERRMVLKYETEYSSRVLLALQKTFSPKRVQIANLKIDMNMSKRTKSERNILPTVLKEDNPNTPYDDSEIVDKLVVSEETVNKTFTGTGYNPEGPAGVEGNNPPVYSDMSNVVGKSEENAAKKNYAFGERNINEETSPDFDRVTVSVNIDGRWELEYGENNLPILEHGHLKRKYTPLTEEELKNAAALVQGAVGYTKSRGDNVVVTNIPFDRSDEHNAEDLAFIAKLQRNKTIMFSLVGVAVILIAFIAFRIISREIEKRRRLAEEARIREQEEARQRALMEAQQQGMEVTMSVEERKRAELQENAIAMAKEHPEDVAMLIRTWLMEE